MPFRICLKDLEVKALMADLGLPDGERRQVEDLLEKLWPPPVTDLDDLVPLPPGGCPIGWRPTVLTPVFWGKGTFEPDRCLPVPLRVYYPSLDGSVQNATMLERCGGYPLILFLHGHCASEGDHRHRSERMLAQLARSGFVVAAPFLSTIGSGPQSATSFDNVRTVLRWMRRIWPGHSHLLPQTGVVGHSYGGMLGARVATTHAASAFAGLSVGVHEWATFGSLPTPLFELKVPSLHAWGTEGLIPDAISDAAWANIALPKHRMVLTGGEHWLYPDFHSWR